MHRAELRAPGFLDQAALQQRAGGRFGADAADPRDLGTRDRLQIGDDRQRLGLGGGQRRRARLGQQSPGGDLGVGMAGQREAAGQLAQHEAAALRRVALAQPLQRLCHLVGLGVGRLRQRRRRAPGRR